MKKLFLYAGIFAASMAFTACDEDYTDWADPQAYAQEDAAAAYGVTVAAGSQANIDMSATPGEVELVAIASDNKNVANILLNSVTVFGQKVPATIENGIVKVDAALLDSLVEVNTLNRSATLHEFDVVVEAGARLVSGEAVPVKATVQAALTPAPTPEIDPAGYALLGQWQGWDSSNPTWMTKVEEGVYQAKVTTGDGDNWYKFYQGSGFGEGEFAWDAVAMGCAVNGDNTSPNLLVWNNDPIYGGFQTPVISGAGTWIITLDMNKMVYSYAPYTEKLWYAGDANKWSFSPLTKVGDHFEGYYYIYLADNASTWGFKFTTTPDWDNPQYGAGDGDGVIAIGGGNCNLPSGNESGFYKLMVNTDNLTFSVEPIAQMSLIGSAIGENAWNDDFDLTFNTETMAWEGTFTVKDGEFKIRANHDWSLSWGGSLDAMTSQNGANLPISAGTYKFLFKPNCDGQGVLTILDDLGTI